MKSGGKKILVTAIVLLLGSVNLFGSESYFDNYGIFFNIGAGTDRLESVERVYDGEGKKVSEIKWGNANFLYLGTGLGYGQKDKFKNIGFGVGVFAKFNLLMGRGLFSNRDWDAEGKIYSDGNGGVYLLSGQDYKINLGMNIPVRGRVSLYFGAAFNYKRYIYMNDKERITMDGDIYYLSGPSQEYFQEWILAGAETKVNVKFKKSEWGLEFGIYPFTGSNNINYHFMKKLYEDRFNDNAKYLQYNDKLEGGIFYDVGIVYGKKVRENMKLVIRANYQWISESRGKTTLAVMGIDEDKTYEYDGGAGAYNNITVGIIFEVGL